MNVVISGCSGLIGTALQEALLEQGHRAIALVRRPPNPGADEIHWNPSAGVLDVASLEGVDAVVNLSGASITAKPWTDEYKQLIVESRVNSTALLARSMCRLDRPPRVFLSPSGTTYYGDRGDELLDESSTGGGTFLANMCMQWEAATRPASEAGIRTVLMRIGMLMSTDGGALPDLIRPYRMGLGGPAGSGKQYVPWITITDQVAAMVHALERADFSGPVNFTVPRPITNAELATAIGRVLRRPVWIRTPRAILAWALGAERSDNLIFSSLRVRPRVLTSRGFTFRHGEPEVALRALLL